MKQLRQHSELDYQLLSRVLSLSLVNKADGFTQTDLPNVEVDHKSATINTSTQTVSTGQHKETQTRESRILSSKLLEAEQMLENFRLNQLDAVPPTNQTLAPSSSEPALNEIERAQLLRNVMQMNAGKDVAVSNAEGQDLHSARPVLVDWPNEPGSAAADMMSDLDSLSTMDTSYADARFQQQSLAAERQVNAEYRKLRRYLDKYERQRAKLERFEHLERMANELNVREAEENEEEDGEETNDALLCNGECGLIETELDDLNPSGRIIRLSSGQTLHFDQYHQPIANLEVNQHDSIKRVRLPEQQNRVDQVRIVEEEIDEGGGQTSHEMHLTHDHYHCDQCGEQPIGQSGEEHFQAEEEQLNSMLIVPEQFQDNDTAPDRSLIVNEPRSINRPTGGPCVRTQSTILIEMGDHRSKECAEISSRTELTREGALCRKTSVTSRTTQPSHPNVTAATAEYDQRQSFSNVRSPQPIVTSPPTTAATTPSATLRRGQRLPRASSSMSNKDQQGFSIHSMPVSPVPPISRCDSALDLPDSECESPFDSKSPLNDPRSRSSSKMTASPNRPMHSSSASTATGLGPAYSESALHTNSAPSQSVNLNDRIQMGISAPSVSFDSPLFHSNDSQRHQKSQQQHHYQHSQQQSADERRSATGRPVSRDQPSDLYQTLPRLINMQRASNVTPTPDESVGQLVSNACGSQNSCATITNELRAEPLPEPMRTGNGACVMALSTETSIQTGPETSDRRIETKSRAVRKYDRSSSKVKSSNEPQLSPPIESPPQPHHHHQQPQQQQQQHQSHHQHHHLRPAEQQQRQQQPNQRMPISSASCANCARCVQKKIRSASSRSFVNHESDCSCAELEQHLPTSNLIEAVCDCESPLAFESASDLSKQRQMFLNVSQQQEQQQDERQQRQMFPDAPSTHSSSIASNDDTQCTCTDHITDPPSPHHQHHHHLSYDKSGTQQLAGGQTFALNNLSTTNVDKTNYNLSNNFIRDWATPSLPVDVMQCDCNLDYELDPVESRLCDHIRPENRNQDNLNYDHIGSLNANQVKLGAAKTMQNNSIDRPELVVVDDSNECECHDCVHKQSTQKLCHEEDDRMNEMYLEEMRSKPGSDSGISSSLSHRSGGKSNTIIDAISNPFEKDRLRRSISSFCDPATSTVTTDRNQKQLLPVSIGDWALTRTVPDTNWNDIPIDVATQVPSQTEIINRITKTKIPEYEYRRGRDGEQKRRKVGNRNKLVFEQQLQSPARDNQSGPCHINSLITMDIPSRLLTARKKSKAKSDQRSSRSQNSRMKSNDEQKSGLDESLLSAATATDETASNTGQMSLSSLSSCSSFASTASDSLSTEDEINTQTKFQRFRPVLITGDQKQTTWEYSMDCACKNGINASVR